MRKKEGAKTKFDPERAARILAWADEFGDPSACKRYGIVSRTLRNWRTRLQTDSAFAVMFRRALKERKARTEEEADEESEKLQLKTAEAINAICDQIIEDKDRGKRVTNPALLDALGRVYQTFAGVKVGKRMLEHSQGSEDEPRPEGLLADQDLASKKVN
jgi:hypothetical protein